ncbi:hypothetical protein ACVT8L_000512 [Campylobacter jejuni]|nr:hypothetical protein QMK11_05390 [Campylobacter jejuni]
MWKNHFYFILDGLEFEFIIFSVYAVFSTSWAGQVLLMPLIKMILP